MRRYFNNFKKNNFNNALTFIEVVIATVILAMGLIPIMSFYNYTSSNVTATIDEVLVTTYANELIDAVCAKKISEIPDTLSKISVDDLSKNTAMKKMLAVLSPAQKGYKRSIEIYSYADEYKVPDNVNPCLKEKLEKVSKYKVIVVFVEYMQSGRKREMKLGTVLCGS